MGFYLTDAVNTYSLFKIVEDILLRFELPVSDCREMCYDIASNVADHIVGLKSKIKKLKPKARFVHCAAYSLNLVIQDTLQNNLVCRNYFSMIKDLINTIRVT